MSSAESDAKKLFVAGVSWNTTDDAFFNFFAGFGDVEDCGIIREPGGRSRGFGFVSFKDNSHADKVLSQQVQLDGRKLDIKVAVSKEEMASQGNGGSATPSTKLWVAGISYDTTDDGLFNFFARFGEVDRACVMKDKISGRSRGFGFVSFKEMGPIEDVLAQTDVELDGRKLDIKPAAPRGSRMLRNMAVEGQAEGRGKAQTTKLFVAGLLTSTTEDTFRKYFTQYGTVTDAVIQKDKTTGESRGFGFVTFESAESAKKVLQFSGHSIDSHSVDCKVAVAKPDRTTGKPAAGGDSGGFNAGFRTPFNQANAAATYGRGQVNPYAMAAMSMGMGQQGFGGMGQYGAAAGVYGGAAATPAAMGYGQQTGSTNGRGGGGAAVQGNVGAGQGMGGASVQNAYANYGGAENAYGSSYDNAYGDQQGVGNGSAGNVGYGGGAGYGGRQASRPQRAGASYHPYR